MKNLNLVHVFLLAVVVSVLAACSGGEKTPGQIEMSIWNTIESGNYEKAMDMWYENSAVSPDKNQADQKEFVKAFADKMKSSIEEKGGIQEVKIVSEELSEDGETAIVAVKITFKNGTTQEDDSKYIKVDGKWKISNSK